MHFPFQEKIEVEKGYAIPHELVWKHLGPILTADRRDRIETVVKNRLFSIVPVLEDLYDRGNVSAVLRSAEAFGLGQVEVIQKGEKFKESARTTAGADKWVEVHHWKSSTECLKSLKAKGFQIVATHLSPKSRPITEIDFTKPTALVFGNEKEGISPEMISQADHLMIIPMYGFVQSFNISVAASLCFFHSCLERRKSLEAVGDLTLKEQSVLKAVYAARTLDSAADQLKRLTGEGR